MAIYAPLYVRLDEDFFERHFGEIPDATLEAHAPLVWQYSVDLLSTEPPPPPRFIMLTERINAMWQSGKGKFYGRRDGRGDPIVIEPIGRRLSCRRSLSSYEWMVGQASDDWISPHDDLWRDLYLTREDVDVLVAEVKQSLGMPVPATTRPARTIPGPAGLRTNRAEKAEFMAGDLIIELVKRDERPTNIGDLIEDLRKKVAHIGHLSEAAGKRQWAKHAPRAWKEAGRRKKSSTPEIK